MIPFGHDTVTLYHKTAGGYERHLLTGCSWRERALHTFYDGSQTRQTEISVRWTCDQQKPAPGDVLIHGLAYNTITSAVQIAPLIEAYAASGAFLCTSVSDNSGVPLPHYCARG